MFARFNVSRVCYDVAVLFWLECVFREMGVGEVLSVGLSGNE